ncbi:MAG: proline dehydrogenase family protein [Candidatus Limnocylindrales bacterium]
MSPFRSGLLWASRNPWLRGHVPRWRFVRRATRRFMPGEDLSAALAAAERFQGDGIGTVLTQLGENITTMGEAEAVAAHYLEALGEVRRRGLSAEISVKPTQLGLDLDEAVTLGHLHRLAAAQAAAGGMLWLDMEDHGYVERTLALVRALRAEDLAVGVCLQAYLRRTAADVEGLLPLGVGIRLVKGAYREPRAVAFPAKRDVDLNFLALAARLLQAVRAGGPGAPRVVFATHDLALVARIVDLAEGLALVRGTYEFHMLYGIRVADQRRLAREGHHVRDLIAYGSSWYPWYLRRLAERPANMLFVLRQLLPGR